MREVVQRGRAERSRALRAALSLGTSCAGTFLVLFVSSSCFVGDPEGWGAELGGAAGLLAVGAAAALVGGGLRGSAPIGSNWWWCLTAVPAAGVSLGFTRLFLLALGFDGEVDAQAAMPTWVAAVVLAPLVEEWMCRGVAWREAELLSRPSTALFVTSVLFAFLHGLGGGYLLELPHRFVAGLVFGLLRWRSGSLLPGVLAHAFHNGFATGWPV